MRGSFRNQDYKTWGKGRELLSIGRIDLWGNPGITGLYKPCHMILMGSQP